MITDKLINPKSIVVVGGSNDITKPGGKVLKNIIDGKFSGRLSVVNPKDEFVQGIISHKSVNDIDETDLAVIAISSEFIPTAMETLAYKKNTKAFIVLSAGFSEVGERGSMLEDKIAEIVKSIDGTLIGPNCNGVLTSNYHAAFAGPVPNFKPEGCDCVSASGATMAFFLETAIPFGLSFSTIFSVGNSALVGVEDIVKYWDETFDYKTSSKVKLIYLEQIDKPELLLKHCSSLIKKGCRIAAIKAGSTEAGSRAVSSHTGALAGSDLAVEALFKKAGIVRCYSRLDLAYVALVFDSRELKGNNIAIVTHAGGPGVLLTDVLSKNGMKVPHITGKYADELLSKLYHGASVSNPIDFLATGNAEQLNQIIDYIETRFDNIDATAIIYGTAGIFDVTDIYNVIDEKMKSCNKPVYPIMPSPVVAEKEMKYFLSLGRHCFMDEVEFGKAISKVYFTPEPADIVLNSFGYQEELANLLKKANNGFLNHENTSEILKLTGLNLAESKIVYNRDEAAEQAAKLGLPLAVKVVGPIHKTETGGVILNVENEKQVLLNFDKLISIPGAVAVQLQKMYSGTELFIGAKYEEKYGYIILCGLGGIFVEVLKDISYGLSPISKNEALEMIKGLRSYKILEGVRGKPGINITAFTELIVKVSAMLESQNRITELDINPLIAVGDSIIAVDARIKIQK